MMVDLTGKTLGKYRLVERLGRGGMAEVYKAYQPGLDRYVAIKLMHGYLADDPDFVGRFQREAKAIAALHHPNIVQVHDFDIEGDVYYMVQEYIEGGTLKAYMQKLQQEGKKVPLEETVRIMTAICDAVDYAHRQGRIHRDIKPDNIMFDLHNRPVLTDFGIATIVGGTRFTATGAMVGTPAYMSPEQGKGYPGDERSDVYSLGVVLYEMTTGRVPFDADTPLAVVLKHVNEPLPMPRILNPEVPYSVERVILKALAKDPADRYQSAAELGHALREAVEEEKVLSEPIFPFEPLPDLAGEPAVTPTMLEKAMATPTPTATPISTPPPAPTQPPASATAQPAAAPAATARRTRRTWVWIVGAVVTVILIGCCMTNALRILVSLGEQDLSETPIATQAAKTRPADLTKQPAVAVPQPESVQSLIDQGFQAFNDDCTGDLDRAQALFEQALSQAPQADNALIGQAFVLFCQGHNNPALENVNRAIELSPENGLGYFVRGRIQARQEKVDEAVDDFSTAITLNPDLAEAYYHRALLYIWPLELYDKALEDLNQTIAIKPNFAPAYLERGNLIFGHQNDPQAALDDFNRLVELLPDEPQGYAQRATVYEALENYEQAIVEWTEALARAPAEETHVYYFHRGCAYQFGGYPERAIQDYDQSIAQNPTVEAYLNRGMAYYQIEQDEAALDDFDQVLLLDEGIYQAAAYHAKGWVLAREDDYEQAIEAYTAALEYNFDDYAWPFFINTHPLLDRARAYRASEQFELALDDLNTLIDKLGYNEWARAYLERGLTYRAMGQRVEAMQDLRRAWELADKEELRNEITKLLEEE